MPIAGTWLAANRRPDPQQAPLHLVDPEHAEPGGLDENVTWHGQPYQDVAPAPNVVGDEWVTNIAGVLLDRTPTSHEDGGPHGLAGPAELADAHSVDYGADERESRDFPPFLFAGDRYDSTADEGLGPQGVAPVALLRGLTSDPVNNPALASYLGKPYRFGWYRRTWSEHDFSPPERVHTYRIIRPHVATEVGDAPPPSDAGPYSSPFGSLARAIRNLSPKPAIRRVPEPVDADVVDVPIVGNVDDKWLYVGGALVAGIVGYAYFTRGKRGTLDANAGDVAFGEQGEVYDAYGNLIGQPGGTPGYVPPNIINSTMDVDDRESPTTNAEWGRLARDELSLGGADPQAVTSAIGRFLARQPLSAVDAGLVREAIAVAGYPPEGGPWNVIEAAAPPPALPTPLPAAVTGFHAVGRSDATHVLLAWNPVPGATGYMIQYMGPGGLGPEWPEASNRHNAYLAPGSYSYAVWAVNSAGAGPKTNLHFSA